jgi:hypothetical protein
MPRWRNGRRGGLKNRCSQGLVSSTLSRGTLKQISIKFKKTGVCFFSCRVLLLVPTLTLHP